MNTNNASDQILQQVQSAIKDRAPLQIVGGNSKYFYGNHAAGVKLDVSQHRGIVSYEPSELVMTARAGTTLNEIETTLAASNQMLAFEPPYFGASATIGGTIACNLSGPRRPFAGAARDFVLGCKMINGKAELLIFGGQVMKNVAGYDVSRLMAGALGTLGVLMEISFKVLPKPETEITLVHAGNAATSLQRVHAWQRKNFPISACCFDDEKLYLRLSSTAAAVKQAQAMIGGDVLSAGEQFWCDVREQKHTFFNNAQSLWRISLPSNQSPLILPGKQFYDWGGAQRWLISDAPAEEIRAVVTQAGGHASLFRGETDGEKFHPLPEAMMAVHRQLKQAFDPLGLFNRGRLYRDL